LETYAGSWGMLVERSSNGEEALGVVSRHATAGDPISVVIMDRVLPDMECESLAKALQQRGCLNQTKLILLDSKLDEPTGESALQSGFSGFLTYPVKQSQLFDCICSVLFAEVAAAQEILKTSIAEGEEPTLPKPSRILLAEDNPVNRMVAMMLLKQLGFSNVHAVSNGQEAVDALAKGSYSAVLMDSQMLEMDGFDATRGIRKAEALTGKRVPIIAMTAHAMQGDRERCLASGMDDYLSKPVTLDDLKNVLRRWIGGENGGEWN